MQFNELKRIPRGLERLQQNKKQNIRNRVSIYLSVQKSAQRPVEGKQLSAPRRTRYFDLLIAFLPKPIRFRSIHYTPT